MLSAYTQDNTLIPAFASSNIEIYPYQIAVAGFALRSSYLRGVICADECSLGKTYEALLVATQKWYEGKNRILLVLPVNMVGQWVKKIENSFSIPYVLMDTSEAFNSATKNSESSNPFIQEGLVITTYEFATQKADYIKAQKWDMVIFDEADRLNKSHTRENRTSARLKLATDGSFKMLLTPTPIEMDIRDIYGLLHFIDEDALPCSVDEFYDYYFRRPDRYPELAEWVSQYCFRTLKSQVDGYANFTERVPYTVGCDFTEDEKKLYNKLQEYINQPVKIAYPQMEQWEMKLQHNHILSSSAQAYWVTLDNAINNLKNLPAQKDKLALYKVELQTLEELKELTKAVKINGKMTALLSLLKKCFVHLKQLKFPQKAIIYVDNLTTMEHLYSLLTEQGYATQTFSGANSRDFDLIERYREGKSVQVQVLIATGNATKGLDLEFCPLVINYDILSNALEMEQRISRCHRQGQISDVLIINLFNRDNEADIRYLELINKRTLQFEGIFGLSDTVLGNFDANIDDVISSLRQPVAIQEAFSQNLLVNESQNKEIVAGSLNSLFTTFTKEVANQVTVTPQYIESEIQHINDELWEVVKGFFKQYNQSSKGCKFEINEQQRTISPRDYTELPILFYYAKTGYGKPYRSLRGYGMDKNYKPHQGRITLVSPIGSGAIENIECANEGILVVDGVVEPCTIGLYEVLVSMKERATYSSESMVVARHYLLVGKTTSGKMMTNEECQKIMAMPVIEFTESNQKSVAWLKYMNNNYHELDGLVPQDEILQASKETATPAISEEIERLKRITARRKIELERIPHELKEQIRTLNHELAKTTDRISQSKIKRQISLIQKELNQRREGLYRDSDLLDAELKRQIAELTDGQGWLVEVVRQFVVNVSNGGILV